MDKREYEEIGLRIRTVQRSLGLVDKDVAELLCIEVVCVFYCQYYLIQFRSKFSK